MGQKYEVLIYNYKVGETESVLLTRWFIRAWIEMLKQNKKWPCVYLARRP